MRVAVCSDVHLEFGELTLKNITGADVLVLSGDICLAQVFDNPNRDGMAISYKQFFDNCCSEFKNVIYIMGNHEHYDYDFANTVNTLKYHLGNNTNLHILDNNTVDIDGYTFIGGTMWTDMNGGDEATMYHVGRCMNDFRIITNSLDDSGYYTTQYAADEFKKTVSFIEETVKSNPDGKYVVVTHHAPSKQSTHPKYQNDTLMNGGYSSNLDFFIEDHPQIKLWTHGHTHETFDYVIGSTRIVCNPRGYINYELRADYFVLKSFDL